MAFRCRMDCWALSPQSSQNTLPPVPRLKTTINPQKTTRLNATTKGRKRGTHSRPRGRRHQRVLVRRRPPFLGKILHRRKDRRAPRRRREHPYEGGKESGNGWG